MSMSQGRFTYHHNKVLHCLTTEMSKHFAGSRMILLYAGLPGIWSDCPQATIPYIPKI